MHAKWMRIAGTSGSCALLLLLTLLVFLALPVSAADAGGWQLNVEKLPGAADWASVSVSSSYATWRSDGEIVLFDLDSRKSSRIFSAQAKLGYPVIDGRLVVWSAGPRTEPWDVYVHDIDTGQTKVLPIKGHSPDVWWDKVAFAGDAGIYLYDAGLGSTRLIASASDCFRPQIRGRFVSWQRLLDPENWSSVELYVHDIYANETRRVTTNEVEESSPCLGDNYLAWTAGEVDRPNSSEVYLYSLDSRHTYRLTNDNRDDSGVCVSQGNVVWQSEMDGDPNQSEIFLYNTYSKKTLRLTTNNYPDQFPTVEDGLIAWSASRPHSRGPELCFYEVESGLVSDVPLPSPDAPVPILDGGRIFWADGSDGFSGVWVATRHWNLSDTDFSVFLPAIQVLASKNIVNGFPDLTFRPDQPVTRQQFAKMIAKATGIPVSASAVCPFPDVSRNLDPGDPLYPDKYIGAAWRAGFIKGYADGRFGPTDTITRAQAITMVVRAAERWNPGLLSEPLAAYECTWGNFDREHAANARKAEYNGIFHYDLSQLDPYEPMTRAEVAQVLYDYLRLIRIQPVDSGPSPVLSPQKISDILLRGWEVGRESYSRSLVVVDYRVSGDWAAGLIHLRQVGGAAFLLHRVGETWHVGMLATDWDVEWFLAEGVPPELIDRYIEYLSN